MSVVTATILNSEEGELSPEFRVLFFSPVSKLKLESDLKTGRKRRPRYLSASLWASLSLVGVFNLS